MNERPAYMSPDQLEERRVYVIYSRNLRVGAWDPGVGGFMGIREKFYYRFVDTEYENTPPGRGTAMAIRPLDEWVPPEIPLTESLGTRCSRHEEMVPAHFVNDAQPPRIQGHWEHDDGSPCDNVHPMSITNTALFDFLLVINDRIHVEEYGQEAYDRYMAKIAEMTAPEDDDEE